MRKRTVFLIFVILTLSFKFSCGKLKRKSLKLAHGFDRVTGLTNRSSPLPVKRATKSCSAGTPRCKCRRRHSIVCSKPDCLQSLPTRNVTKETGEKITSIIVTRQKNLTTLSSDDLIFFPNLRSARWSRNGIEYMARDVFFPTPHLEILDLHRNKLEFIPRAVHDLRRLRALNLGGNQISTIGDTAFENLLSLKVLILRRNLLKTMPKNLPTTLVKLSLSKNAVDGVGDLRYLNNTRSLKLDSNSLLTIDSNSLPISLRELSLCNNKLTTSHSLSFNNLIRLKRLRLAGNVGIKKITSHTFFHTTSRLQELDLRGCKISSIDSGSFSLFPNLQTLDLAGNQLKAYDSQWFVYNRQLTRMTLAGNKWICNCAFVQDISKLKVALRKQLKKKAKKSQKIGKKIHFINDFGRIICNETEPKLRKVSGRDESSTGLNFTSIDKSSCDKKRQKRRLVTMKPATPLPELKRYCTEDEEECQFPVEYLRKTYTSCIPKSYLYWSDWCYTNKEQSKWKSCVECQ